MKIDDLLERFGLKYEVLTQAERDTLTEMYSAVQATQLTPERMKAYVISMKNGVEEELTKHSLSKSEDKFLKARLRNYLLFEAFLTSPDRAKMALESALSGYKT